MSRSGITGWDPRLRRLLAAYDRREANRQFDQLYRDSLSKMIESVITEEIGDDLPATHEELNDEADTFDDLSILVRGRIAVRLLHAWEASHQDQANPPRAIGNLHGYVVAAARNACVDYLRQEHPGRHALDNSLRAVLAKGPDLAIWKVIHAEGSAEWRCGRGQWRDQQIQPVSLHSSSNLQRILKQELERLRPKDALPRIFEIVRAPLRFNELLGFLADYWDVERTYRQRAAEMVPFRVPKAYQRIQPDDVVEVIGTVQSTWGQVRRLAPLQAAVLLLKAPPLETEGFLEALVTFGIADWQEMAKVLGLSAEILYDVAPDLPLEDAKIASLTGIPLEDVPRIRQDARRRMRRQSERWHRQRQREQPGGL